MIIQMMRGKKCFDDIQVGAFHGVQSRDQVGVERFSDQLIEFEFVKVLTFLETKDYRHVHGIVFQLFANTLEISGFAALAGREDGKISTQINHCFKILVVRVGDILKGDKIGCFR